MNGRPHLCQSCEVNCHTLSEVRPDKRIFTVQHNEWVTFLSCDKHVLGNARVPQLQLEPHAEDSSLAGAEAAEVDGNGFLQLMIACRNQEAVSGYLVHHLSG